jgi:hypothetical protein
MAPRARRASMTARSNGGPMSRQTHRCSVEGCPNLAAYEVFLYDFDDAEGAVLFRQDDTCPFICVEHAIDNERQAAGERRLNAVIAYPHTNQSRAAGLSIYRQQEPAYIA